MVGPPWDARLPRPGQIGLIVSPIWHGDVQTTIPIQNHPLFCGKMRDLQLKSKTTPHFGTRCVNCSNNPKPPPILWEDVWPPIQFQNCPLFGNKMCKLQFQSKTAPYLAVRCSNYNHNAKPPPILRQDVWPLIEIQNCPLFGIRCVTAVTFQNCPLFYNKMCDL